MKKDLIFKIALPIILLIIVFAVSYIMFRSRTAPQTKLPLQNVISNEDALKNLTPDQSGARPTSSKEEKNALKSLSPVSSGAKKLSSDQLNKALQSLSPQ